MWDSIFGDFLVWLPFFLSLVVIILMIGRRILTDKKVVRVLKLNLFTYQRLAGAWFIFIILFNSFLTWLQYHVWASSPFSKLFLPPIQPINYFIGYVYIHFWQAVVLSLGISLVFYGILRLAKFYNQEIISSEELVMIPLVCWLVGWPKFLVLIPLFFLLAIFSSIINLLIFKNNKIDIFWPLIYSALISLLGANYLIYFLKFIV